MIWKIFLIAIMIPTYIYMFYKYYKTTIYENGIVLLVNIPYEYKDNGEILEITKKAQKGIKYISIISIILMIIYFLFIDFFINEFFMFTLLGLLLLPMGFMMVYLNGKHKKLKTLKIENNWLIYSDYYISFDTRIINSGLKNKYNKLFKYDIFLTAIILILYLIFKNRLEIANIIILLINFNTINFTNILLVKLDAYIYVEENYEENYNINKKKIDKNYVIIKNLIVIEFILMIIFLIIALIKVSSQDYFIAINVLQIIIWVIFFIVFYLLNKEFEIKTDSISDSGDYYDYYGYNNPNDARVLVPNPIMSTNMEVNRGNFKGKLYYLLATIFILAVCIWGTIVLSNAFNAEFNYTVGNNELNIHVDMYKKNIIYSEIESIKLEDDIDFSKSRRIFGNAMEDYSAGKYFVIDYGNIWLFVKSDVNKYIVIKTEKDTYIFNDNTEKDTRKLFGKIRAEI